MKKKVETQPASQETDVNVSATQTEETALVTPPTVEAGMLIGQSDDIFKSNLMAMWTSIDPAKKSLILKASGDADFSLIGWFDKNPAGVIYATDVLCHNVMIANDDGEVDENGEPSYSSQTRTVIVDKDGNTYSAVSGGVLASLQKIFALYGHPITWPAGGLPLIARRVKTRKFQTINLLVQD